MDARTLSRPLLVFAPLLLVLGLAACGDDDDTGSDDATEQPAGDDDTRLADGGEEAGAADEGTDGATTADDGAATVTAADFSFTVDGPVEAGAEVTFENTGSAPHTLTADDDAFDSGRVEGGSSGSITAPATAGAYTFHCEVHPAMTGTLTVSS
jgi:plastocyanin